MKKRSTIKLNKAKIEVAVMAVATGTPLTKISDEIDVSPKSVFNWLARGERIINENASPATPDDKLCVEFYQRITDAQYNGDIALNVQVS